MKPGQVAYEDFYKTLGAWYYLAFEALSHPAQQAWASAEAASMALVQDQPDYPATPTGRSWPKPATSPRVLADDLNGLP